MFQSATPTRREDFTVSLQGTVNDFFTAAGSRVAALRLRWRLHYGDN